LAKIREQLAAGAEVPTALGAADNESAAAESAEAPASEE